MNDLDAPLRQYSGVMMATDAKRPERVAVREEENPTDRACHDRAARIVARTSVRRSATVSAAVRVRSPTSSARVS